MHCSTCFGGAQVFSCSVYLWHRNVLMLRCFSRVTVYLWHLHCLDVWPKFLSTTALVRLNPREFMYTADGGLCNFIRFVYSTPKSTVFATCRLTSPGHHLHYNADLASKLRAWLLPLQPGYLRGAHPIPFSPLAGKALIGFGSFENFLQAG